MLTNGEQYIIKNAYKFVWAKGIFTPDPTYGISISGCYKTRDDKFLNLDELKILFDYSYRLKPQMANLFKLMAYTGLRRNEARCLRWSNIHLDHSVIILPAEITKSKVRQTVYLGDKVIAFISNLPRGEGSEYVFHNPKTKKPWSKKFISRCFDAVLNAAGLKRQGIGIHILRHTYVSLLISEGHVELSDVQKLARHSRMQTTLIYAHLSSSKIKSAANMLPDF